MAKGKGTNTKYVSKGQRRNVAKNTQRTTDAERLLNKVDAWFAGKNVILGNHKKPKKDRITARDVWGNPGRFTMPTS